jgi:hypothetical protein
VRGLDYLDYKGAIPAPPQRSWVLAGLEIPPDAASATAGYQDPVSLAVLGGDDAADDAAGPLASPPHPILLPHEMPGAPPVSGIPPDLLSSENDPDSSEPERGGALRIRVAAGGAPLSAVADSSEASSDASDQ